MAKQLNIDLNFNANTEKAKQSILDLQQTLSNIAKMPGQASSLFDDRDIKKASQSALELQRHLEKAVNTKTGKLDLSRFSISLKAAGKDLNKYYDNLLKIGPEGQKAFLQIASAVASAETPIVRVNKKLEEMGTVLKNTVRWQISSSILHGFMGSIQKAYGYAKDLNESLNNIRIVTGQSADQMSKFAIEANRAAKELSTTTNEYAKASLIYYQQGLNDSDVKARTDITIKMANVARESAETVSDQMTAVWNNFYDGSDSLESYADKMTALGAATASSTSEISEGLNKFAGIADTVGLSFDYASAALATVTATSRQSADIVGTAFKTMFARIQGLKLGETLEDGTTLNKYSEALMKVGVNIKDQSGNLKDMDTILSEMASKWETLRKDEQVALAQTVAGTRQYTQLVTLMNNWHFMEDNLKVVEESNGVLAKQQAIYEEGWEAARDRVRAAMESIYDDLLDDDFFVTVLNGFSKVLDAIHGVTEGLGGMKGVAALVSSVFMNLYAKKMPEAMQNLRANFMVFTGQGEKEMNRVQQQTKNKIAMSMGEIGSGQAYQTKAESVIKLTELQQKYALMSKTMTTLEKAEAEARIENIKNIYGEIDALAKKAEEAEKATKQSRKNLQKSGIKGIFKNFVDFDNIRLKREKYEKKSATAKEESESFRNQAKSEKKKSQARKDFAKKSNEQWNFATGYDEEISRLDIQEEEIDNKISNINQKLVKLGGFGDLDQEAQAEKLKILAGEVDPTKGKFSSSQKQQVAEAIDSVTASYQKLSIQVAKLNSLEDLTGSQANNWQEATKEINNNIDATKNLQQNMELYTKMVQKSVEDSGVELSKDQSEKLNKGIGDFLNNLKQIEPESEDAAEKSAEAFTELSKIIKKVLSEALKPLEDVDGLGTGLGAYEELFEMLGPETLEQSKEFKQNAETEAREKAALIAKQFNVQQMSDDFQQPVFDVDEAFTELGSTLMSTYSLITSLQSAFQVFGDESATSLEKVGAAMSILMSVTSAYSSITQFSTALTKNETIAKWALGKANQAAALSAKELSAATGALSVKIALAVAAITLIIKGLDVLIVTQKEANENIQKTTESYKEEFEKLKNINEELDSTANRIKELSEKGSLTIVEEDELTRLKSTNAQLERQKDLQKQITKEKAKQTIKTIKQNWDTASELTDYVFTMAPVSGYVSGGGPNAIANSYYAAAKTAPENSNLPGATSMTEEQREAWIKANQDIVQKNEETYLDYIQAMQEAGEEVDRDFIEKTKTRLEEGRKILYGEEYDDKVLGSVVKDMENSLSESNFEQNSGWGKALGQETLDALGIQEEAFNNYVSNAIDRAKEANITTEQLASLDGKALQVLVQHSEELSKYSGEDLLQFLTNYGYEIPPVFEKTKELREELEKVSKISKDISIGKILTQEDYQILTNYNSELEKYFTILADGSAMFTGDPLDFQQEIEKQKRNDLIQIQQDAKKATSIKQQELNELVETGVNPLSAEDFARRAGYSENYDNYVKSLENNYINQHDAKVREVQEAQSYQQAITNEIALGADNYNERQELLQNKTINQDAYAKAAETAINKESWDGLKPEEIQEYSDYLEDTFGIAEEGAEEVARSITKMNKGVESLKSNWEEWGDILKKSSKDSEEYTKAMKGTKHALSDVLDVSEDFIDTDWVESADNMALIEKAAQGDAEAIDALGASLAKDIALDSIDNLQNKLGNIISNENLEVMKNNFVTALDEMQLAIQNHEFDLGETVNLDGLLGKLNHMVSATGMSVEEANAMYRSMGFTPHFKRTPITADAIVPITTKHHHRDYIGEKDPVTGEWTDWIDTEYSTTEEKPAGETKLTALTMATEAGDYRPTVPTPQIEGATYTGGGSMNNHSSSNSGGKKSGGGGGGKPKKTKVSKQSDTVERYKEINDKLDDIKDSMDDVNKAADRLYGNSRITQMKKVNELLEKEVKLTAQKKAEAQAYLKRDKQALQQAAREAGISFGFDAQGNISNYTEQMNKLSSELISTQNAANADGNATEEENEAIQKIQEKIDKVKDALSQYDETRELIEDLDNEIRDKLYEWQDNNAEMLSYKVELEIEINDMELETIEYYLNKISDDFYKSAESAALLANKFPYIQDSLSDWSAYTDGLKKAYEGGEISHDAYIEGLKESRSSILENLESLNELDKEMMEYYGNTLAAAGEEIAKYTSQMEHSTSVLDHYRDIMGLLGKEVDYEAMGIILEAQGQVVKNGLDVAVQNYHMYADEVTRWQEKMDSAVEGSEAWEVYKKNWESAVEATNEAQEEMLSKTAQYAEQMKAILENNLNKANKGLENALTGGAGFDKMNTGLERAQALQEEYLTTTNKVYETNKLIRTAQNALDTTNNKLAKKRLNNFIAETEELQKKGKLSKFELDIQKAKYDLTVAEMALQDAKDARSKVRLSRDSEGNFSYVYTADANKVAEAEQKFEDAQNNLYNMSLEGANRYSEKYQETLNGLYDSLTDLNQRWLDGEFASQEEYDQAVADTQAYYYEQLSNYSDLYHIALETDARIVDGIWQDSQELMSQAHKIWSAESGQMSVDSETWKNNVTSHVEQVKNSFIGWQESMKEVEESLGNNLTNLKDKTSEVVKGNNDLKHTLTDEVFPAVEEEINETAEASDKYAELRKRILEVISEYEVMAKKLSETIEINIKYPDIKPIVIPIVTDSSEFKLPSEISPNVENSSGGTEKDEGTPKKSLAPDYHYVGKFSDIVINPNTAEKSDDKKYLKVGKYWIKLSDISTATTISEGRGIRVVSSIPKYEYYNTGGYTGEWGPEGRLAVLHQKEIVLNKEDTSNLLNVVKLTRSMIDALDLNARNASLAFENLTPNTIRQSNNQTLQQEVTIRAEFPNVTQHSEIEEAFRTLVNESSQFANRKNF